MNLENWMTVFRKLSKWLDDREIRKAQRESELVAAGIIQMHYLAATFHGRYQLSQILEAVEAGDLELDPIIVNMYEFFLKQSHFKAYAIFN